MTLRHPSSSHRTIWQSCSLSRLTSSFTSHVRLAQMRTANFPHLDMATRRLGKRCSIQFFLRLLNPSHNLANLASYRTSWPNLETFCFSASNWAILLQQWWRFANISLRATRPLTASPPQALLALTCFQSPGPF